MFTMDDIVSGIEVEEKIEIFGERLSRSRSNKYTSENIISEDDGFLFRSSYFELSVFSPGELTTLESMASRDNDATSMDLVIFEKILNGFHILGIDADIRMRSILSYILPQGIDMSNIWNADIE